MKTILKLFAVFWLGLATLAMQACTTMENPYGRCGPYGCYNQRSQEPRAVAAAQEAKATIEVITAESFMPAHLRNCSIGPTNVSGSGSTRGGNDISWNTSQSCEPQKTRQGGAVRPLGLDGVSLEECIAVNFSAPQCAKYGRPVAAGGTR